MDTAYGTVPRTVCTGGMTKGELLSALRQNGIQLNEIAQVFDRAAERGFVLCPLELAAHLRLQFTDQPEGFLGHPPSTNRAPPGALTIAAHPLVADDGVPMGFYLRRIRGVLWLRGYRSPAEHVWSASDRFVFCRQGEVPAA